MIILATVLTETYYENCDKDLKKILKTEALFWIKPKCVNGYTKLMERSGTAQPPDLFHRCKFLKNVILLPETVEYKQMQFAN